MRSEAADGSSASNTPADFVTKRGTRYRAICLACGASSAESDAEAPARQWSRGHRHDASFPIDMIIESKVPLPRGTLGRFFRPA